MPDAAIASIERPVLNGRKKWRKTRSEETGFIVDGVVITRTTLEAAAGSQRPKDLRQHVPAIA